MFSLVTVRQLCAVRRSGVVVTASDFFHRGSVVRNPVSAEVGIILSKISDSFV